MSKVSKYLGIALTVWTLCQMASTALASLAAYRAAQAADAAAASARSSDYRPNLSTPIGQLQNAAVVCPGSGAAAPIRVPADGSNAASMMIYNSSTTCVRVGGSAVTSVTGVPIGSGCDGGVAMSVDAREAFCISSAVGTVTVQALFGKQ